MDRLAATQGQTIVETAIRFPKNKKDWKYG